MQEARTLEERALTLTGNPAQWEATLAAARSEAKRAEALETQEEAALDPAVRDRLEAFKAQLNADENDRLFVARFEDIRLEQSETDVKRSRFRQETALPKIKDALKAYYEIDFGVTPIEQVVRLMQQRPIPVQEQLRNAFDVCLVFAPRADVQTRQWLVAVLEAADTDPWRTDVLRTVDARNRQALGKLVQQVKVAQQPPAFLLLLVHVFPDRDTTMFRLLRQIQRVSPGDFWANLGLAQVLTHSEPPQYDEALRSYTAALALRPQSPGIYVNLAGAFRLKRDLDSAMDECRRALALNPVYAAAHNNLGAALQIKADLDGAIAEYRQAIALNPETTTWAPP